MAVRQMSKGAVRRLISSDTRVDEIRKTALQLSGKDEYVHEIAQLWQDVQDKFLLIGRYLNRAKADLPHGEYQAMVERELPFGVQIAFQLRSVAEAIDSGRLLEQEVPNSYSVIYQITTLNDEELRIAREQKILRPSLTRAEIIRFKRDLRMSVMQRRALLRRRRDHLLAEQQRIQEELRQIEAELGAELIEGTARQVGD